MVCIEGDSLGEHCPYENNRSQLVQLSVYGQLKCVPDGGDLCKMNVL